MLPVTLHFVALDRLFPLNQMPPGSQETKKKVKSFITVFVCLGLKRVEKDNGNLPEK